MKDGGCMALGDGGGAASVTERLAREVRNARQREGLSQRRLGELCGVGQSRISSVECGHVVLVSPVVLRIAEALGKELVVRLE